MIDENGGLTQLHNSSVVAQLFIAISDSVSLIEVNLRHNFLFGIDTNGVFVCDPLSLNALRILVSSQYNHYMNHTTTTRNSYSLVCLDLLENKLAEPSPPECYDECMSILDEIVV